VSASAYIGAEFQKDSTDGFSASQEPVQTKSLPTEAAHGTVNTVKK